MLRSLAAFALALGLLVAAPRPAGAQAGRAVAGAAVGAAGGVVVTLSVIVFRARFYNEYLDSAEDLVHWQSTPMIAAPAAGVLFGFAGDGAFRGSVVGSVSGMLAGAAAGTGLGWLSSRNQESPWAGGVIGAGVGLSIGGLLGGLRGWKNDETPHLEFPTAVRVGFSVPLQ